MYYINRDYVSKERYDLAKFVEFYTTDGYDILTSYFAEQIRNLPLFGVVHVASRNFRPDIVAYDVYGYTQFWWVIMSYNDLYHPDDLDSELTIQYPSITDLEHLYFKLRSIEIANLRASSSTQITFTPVVIVNTPSTKMIPRENPGISWNGSVTNFSITGSCIDESEMIFKNGILLDKTDDYIMSGEGVVTLSSAPESGDSITYTYQVDEVLDRYLVREVAEIEEVSTGIELSSTPVSNTEMILRNGILQHPAEDYVISGSDVTFLAPLIATEQVTSIYQVAVSTTDISRRTRVITREEPELREYKRSIRLLYPPYSDTEWVFKNGVLQVSGEDYDPSFNNKSFVIEYEYDDPQDHIAVVYQAEVLDD